jgi:hypothetical protein
MVRRWSSTECAVMENGQALERQCLTLQIHRQQSGLSSKQQGVYQEQLVTILSNKWIDVVKKNFHIFITFVAFCVS